MKQELINLIPELKERKAKGENIQQYLETLGYPQGSTDVIELSYDLQAGDDYRFYLKHDRLIYEFANEIFKIIIPFVQGDIESVLDCGTGEGTTLMPFLDLMCGIPDRIFACDISFKRLEVFKREFNHHSINLIRSDMTNLPFLDNSFDLVTTFNSIEPNFENSDKILSEVIRVAKKYVLLVEPIYELADKKQQKRMDELKYFRGLPYFLDKNTQVETLKIHKIEHNTNPDNISHLILLKKK